jgi:hypothetical protein
VEEGVERVLGELKRLQVRVLFLAVGLGADLSQEVMCFSQGPSNLNISLLLKRFSGLKDRF